jgi:NADP-dependent 3-hydroxy acid dehydrogenase YdfG
MIHPPKQLESQNHACGNPSDSGFGRNALLAELKKKQPSTATMDVEHAARSVLHMAELPPEANVQFMTVMATTMPYIGRG